MNWLNPKTRSRRARRRPVSPPAFLPKFEPLEPRVQPAVNFLQGFTWVDGVGDNSYDKGDTVLPNVPVQLWDSGNHLVASTVSGGDGYYRFDNVTPGKYSLVELVPSSYASSGTQISSLFDPGTQTAKNTIQVTVGNPDPNPLYLNDSPSGDSATGTPGGSSGFVLTNGSYSAPFNAYTAGTSTSNAYQIVVSLTAGSPESAYGSRFYTFCMDLFHANPDHFTVFTSSTPGIPSVSGLTANNLGRIGYLYNTYGRFLASAHASPTWSAGEDGTGLQLAMWELLYDSTPDLVSGNFRITPGSTSQAVLNATNFYLTASAGKDERAVFLNYTGYQTDGTLGSQGMMTTELFNFGNQPAPTPPANPSIKIVKTTNGTDNDTGTGPLVPAGSTVTWKYEVTNSGNVPLKNVGVADDQAGVSPAYQSGDGNSNGLLDPGETWVYLATGVATAGQYGNVGTATGTDATGTVPTPVTAANPDHYFGVSPSLTLVKKTNGSDNDTGTGPHVAVGSTVTWTYFVQNTGNVPLKDVGVSDDQAGVSPAYQSGDGNGNGRLDPGETWVYAAAGVATAGQYANVGTATGTDATGTVTGAVSDTNPDHYFGDAPSVHIVKLVNGVDADSAPGIHVPIGSALTFTYIVTNPGNVPLITVGLNDNVLGPVTSFTGDANGNGQLEPGETWAYTITSTAVAGLNTNTGTVTGVDAFNPGLTVTDNNPANYYADSPAVKIVKFVNGIDADSAPGVVVAVGSTLTFTYVLTNPGDVPLKTVAVNDDVLGPITSFTGDSDGNGQLDPGETWTYTKTAVAVLGPNTNTGTVTGADAFTGESVTDNNPANYNAYAPASLGDYVWEDVNGNGIQDDGNTGINGVVLELLQGSTVVATATTADNGATHGYYQFAGLAPGTYQVRVAADNPALAGFTATFTGRGTPATDSNPSPTGTTLASGGSDQTLDFGFYKPVSVGDFVWNDANGNGIQDGGETGINGVTLTLTGKDGAGNTVGPLTATTVTVGGKAGAYQFGSLPPGTYAVAVTTPAGYAASSTSVGSNRAVDSNPSPTGTTPVALASGGSDQTLDFGFYKPGVITGVKYDDVSGNGLNLTTGPNAPADSPLPGVTIYLDLNNNGCLDSGEPSAVTGPDGSYAISVVAGTYTVREVAPAGSVRTYPALSDHYTVTVAAGATSKDNTFANTETCNPNTITGVSFYIIHPDQTTRTVTDLRGNTKQGDVIRATFTVNVPAGKTHEVSFVSYTAPGPSFDATTASLQQIYDLATCEFGPGVHTLTVSVPNCYYQVDFVCGLAIDKLGPAGSNIFYTPQSRLESADNGGTCACGAGQIAGQFATIGFWQNSNGQAVMNSFNGGSAHTELGYWLAATFPDLFGTPNTYTKAGLYALPGHPTTFAGLTNAQIGALYKGLWNPSGTAKNTYVQAFAVALGIYADTRSLGGQSLADNGYAFKYGFNVSLAGGGLSPYAVGSNGSAFSGLGGTPTVLQILQKVSASFTPSNGCFYSGNQTTTAAANNVLNGINTHGDISLVTSDSSSTRADQALISPLQPLNTGTLVVAIDALPAGDPINEQARIDDVIALLNGTLGEFGVTIVEVQGGDETPADIHIHFADTSAIGGVAEGVLGVTQAGGEITIIRGWNYYLGSDPAGIGAGQYDFGTVIAHELGHAVGLGHSTDSGSVMFPYLDILQTRRQLTDADLFAIREVETGDPEPLLAASAAGALIPGHKIQSFPAAGVAIFAFTPAVPVLGLVAPVPPQDAVTDEPPAGAPGQAPQVAQRTSHSAEGEGEEFVPLTRADDRAEATAGEPVGVSFMGSYVG